MELHPLSSLFPRMSGSEFEAFKDDIATNGQREPITIHNGLILDGGNRFRACIELNMEPDIKEFEGESIVAFILSANLHRRHLTAGQQAAIVASVQDWDKAHPAHKVKAGNVTALEAGNVTKLDTVADRTALSGASEKTQRTADKIARENPELIKKVARGEVTLAEASGIERKATPKPEPVQEPAFDPRQHELDELRTSVEELSEENQDLREAISVGRLSEVHQASAAEMIAAMRTKIKTLEATLAAVTISRDDLMKQVSQMKAQIIRHQKEIKNLKG